jgi:hypothetical protein
MPRPNLKYAQAIVRRFCDERGIPYAESSAFASYSTAMRHLHSVGDGLRQPAADIDRL